MSQETEYYEETINRYRVYKKCVADYARDDEQWTLEWSFNRLEDAEDQASKQPSYEREGAYIRKVVDAGERTSIRRQIW
jgi:hypothetical protein